MLVITQYQYNTNRFVPLVCTEMYVHTVVKPANEAII